MTASETTRGRLLFAVWLGSTIGLILQANSDVAAGDSGEIGGAAQKLGGAHPTGFCLGMVLLRAAGLLPLGSLAFRQNVAVACIAACAVTAIARLTSLICEQIGVDMRARAWML